MTLSSGSEIEFPRPHGRLAEDLLVAAETLKRRERLLSGVGLVPSQAVIWHAVRTAD